MDVSFWCLNQYQILLRECRTLSSLKEPPEENNYLYVPIIFYFWSTDLCKTEEGVEPDI